MSGKIKIVLVVSAIIQQSTGTLYSGFTACKVKDAEFESCLNKAIENGIKLLQNGLPDYNLLPLDPFSLPSLQVGAGTGAVHLVQNYKDITITGFTDLTINNSHVDFDKKTLSFSAIHPLLTQKADYDINGKILMLPVHGKGPSTLVLENCLSNHYIEFDEQKNGDDTIYKAKSYTVKLHPAHARYVFENLFDGNKLLGDNINRVINQEWLTIFKDVGEGYEVAYAKIFLRYTQIIFEKASINEIFVQ